MPLCNDVYIQHGLSCVWVQVLESIEIRASQLHTAEHILANVTAMGVDAAALGAVMQLNMGEGKTRIILPLLVLALEGGDAGIVRLNFVGELLPDAVAYLHRTLTGAHARCLF